MGIGNSKLHAVIKQQEEALKKHQKYVDEELPKDVEKVYQAGVQKGEDKAMIVMSSQLNDAYVNCGLGAMVVVGISNQWTARRAAREAREQSEAVRKEYEAKLKKAEAPKHELEEYKASVVKYEETLQAQQTTMNVQQDTIRRLTEEQETSKGVVATAMNKVKATQAKYLNADKKLQMVKSQLSGSQFNFRFSALYGLGVTILFTGGLFYLQTVYYRLNRADDECQRIRAQIEPDRKMFEDTVATLRSNLSNEASTKQLLSAEISELKAERDVRTQSIGSLKQLNEQLNKEHEELKSTHEAVKTESTSKLGSLTKKFKDTKDTLLQIKSDHTTLLKKHKAVKQSRADTEEKLTALKSELENARNEAAGLVLAARGETVAAVEEAQAVQTLLNQSTLRVTELEKEVKEQQKELDEMKQNQQQQQQLAAIVAPVATIEPTGFESVGTTDDTGVKEGELPQVVGVVTSVTTNDEQLMASAVAESKKIVEDPEYREKVMEEIKEKVDAEGERIVAVMKEAAAELEEAKAQQEEKIASSTPRVTTEFDKKEALENTSAEVKEPEVAAADFVVINIPEDQRETLLAPPTSHSTTSEPESSPEITPTPTAVESTSRPSPQQVAQHEAAVARLAADVVTQRLPNNETAARESAVVTASADLASAAAGAPIEKK